MSHSMHDMPSTGHKVAQGWILMFLVMVCIFMLELIVQLINGDPFLRSPECARGLRVGVALILVHAFVPMLVCTFDGPRFRWLVTGLTGLFTLAMLAHQAMHLVTHTKEFGYFDLLDLTHHTLGLWVTLLARRWALESPRAGSPRLASPRAA